MRSAASDPARTGHVGRPRVLAGQTGRKSSTPWRDPDYALKDDARVGQLRTMLGVPLLREGVPIGVICTAA